MNKEKEDAYITVDTDMGLTPIKKQECLQIVSEINDLCTSQAQKLYIIQLLALGLENYDLSKKIVDIIKEYRKEMASNIIYYSNG